ncbi:nuclear transport factor 2 family protein [Allomuricauda taeanensis]|uniref:nuclear transport factor 2 family protein n=1 Tax=Flavobacteriaceae TaxID=49546 RepID=UPI001FEAC961|nr:MULTISPECIES: nuclear transport factor 2 family protein [Allomuricauda]MDC6384751.1 nuclear transport factor 2 family protein [Muricauda sp. SK9]MEE1962665.1 nuclear transport factor 2 family protein [Allomuricauda taeanensis]
MKQIKTLFALTLIGLTTLANAQGEKESELYQTIVRMDSIYFNAYNTCDMEKQAEIYDEDLEFYHDMGGLSKDKQGLLESIEKNICGKVTRELVPGSMEVYPINGFGAVEMALHKFHNKEEPNAPSHPSKFIVIWKQVGDQWKISRVVSLH